MCEGPADAGPSVSTSVCVLANVSANGGMPSAHEAVSKADHVAARYVTAAIQPVATARIRLRFSGATMHRVLLDTERERITSALRVWLDRHPEPDLPAFRIAEEPVELTPRQIVTSVAENDHIGQQILAILEYSVRRTSLEEVTADLERLNTEPPSAATGRTPVGA